MADGRAVAQQSTSASQWISRHRQAIVVCAAAVVACGAGFYFLQANSTTGKSTDKAKDGSESTTTGEKKQKKRKHKSKKAKSSPAHSGSEEHDETGQHSSRAHRLKRPADVLAQDPLYMKLADIEVLDEEQRTSYAVQLKGRGNKLYSNKQYDQAVKLYSKALEFEQQAVFYSNRAACYTNLGQHEKVIEDCTAALNLDPSYIKALNRRAHARETIGGQDNLYAALCDFTAAAIIDNFATESTQASVERVMKRLATEQAKDILEVRLVNECDSNCMLTL